MGLVETRSGTPQLPIKPPPSPGVDQKVQIIYGHPGVYKVPHRIGVCPGAPAYCAWWEVSKGRVCGKCDMSCEFLVALSSTRSLVVGWFVGLL